LKIEENILEQSKSLKYNENELHGASWTLFSLDLLVYGANMRKICKEATKI